MSSQSFDLKNFNSIVPVVNRLVEQSHKWRIRTIFVAGSSAQPFAYLFKQLWQAKYREPLPHFLALGKSPYSNKHWHKRLADFAKTNPHLKEMPSMVFDEFAITGKTIQKIAEGVKEAGFTQIKTAPLSINMFGSLKPDFVGARSIYQKELKAREFLSTFAGQRSDILEMGKNRRNVEEMQTFGKQLIEGRAFLKALRTKSRNAAKKYKPKLH